jgi:hypothetical protein
LALKSIKLVYLNVVDRRAKDFLSMQPKAKIVNFVKSLPVSKFYFFSCAEECQFLDHSSVLLSDTKMHLPIHVTFAVFKFKGAQFPITAGSSKCS